MKQFTLVSLSLVAISCGKAERQPNQERSTLAHVTTDCNTISRRACPMHYLPVICNFGELKVDESNRCLALNNLEFQACQQGLALDLNMVHCDNKKPE